MLSRTRYGLAAAAYRTQSADGCGPSTANEQGVADIQGEAACDHGDGPRRRVHAVFDRLSFRFFAVMRRVRVRCGLPSVGLARFGGRALGEHKRLGGGTNREGRYEAALAKACGRTCLDAVTGSRRSHCCIWGATSRPLRRADRPQSWVEHREGC
jgi:hypothetical protein